MPLRLQLREAGPPSGGRAQPRSVVGTAIKSIWVISVLGLAACALAYFLFLFFVATVASGVGRNDGSDYTPLLLLFGLPIACFGLLIGGVLFLLLRPYKPKPPKMR